VVPLLYGCHWPSKATIKKEEYIMNRKKYPSPSAFITIAGIAIGLCTLSTSASADLGEFLGKVKSDFDKITVQGEQDRARIKGDSQPGSSVQAAGGIVMATQPDTSQSKPTQLIVPKDKRVATAMNEAMPTIKKVLGVHQCVQDWQSLRQMNIYAVSGENMAKPGVFADGTFPNSSYLLKYHDLNKCVSITTVDQWSMPALNALLFRAVYFADDSGETVNFLYLFKKVDDGSWKISQFERGH
jgi:hypothetical protein